MGCAQGAACAAEACHSLLLRWVDKNRAWLLGVELVVTVRGTISSSSSRSVLTAVSNPQNAVCGARWHRPCDPTGPPMRGKLPPQWGMCLQMLAPQKYKGTRGGWSNCDRGDCSPPPHSEVPAFVNQGPQTTPVTFIMGQGRGGPLLVRCKSAC